MKCGSKDYTGKYTSVPGMLAWAYEKDGHHSTKMASTF